MKEFTIENIRNFGLFGHGGVGKTSLAEAVIYTAGATSRRGKPDEGTTVADFTDEEIARKISISAALLHCEWKGKKINIVDTPGYADFIGEVYGALRVIDMAVILLSASAGIEVGTEQLYELVDERQLPRAFVVNKMDKEHANFPKCVDDIREVFSNRAVAIMLPIGDAAEFSGIVDIVRNKAYTYDDKGKAKATDIPGDMQGVVEDGRASLMEAAAESDDALMEKFFDAGELTDEEIVAGLRKGIADGIIYPIMPASAGKNMGVSTVLDFVAEYFPSPQDRAPVVGKNPGTEDDVECPHNAAAPASAFVFKTVIEPHVGELSLVRVFSGTFTQGLDLVNPTQDDSERVAQMYAMNGNQRVEIPKIVAGDIGALVKLKNSHTGDTLCEKKSPVIFPTINFPSPIFEMGVHTKAKGDEEKMATGMTRIHEEDPTFFYKVFADLRQTIMYGQGEMHFDVIISKLKKRYNVEVELEKPRIPYRETIKGKAEVQYKYKKQTGGRGQYGDVHIRLKPLPRGEQFEFVDSIVGGVIPSKFIPSVEKGVREAMSEGALSGHPVVDVSVELFYGSYHDVDSSDNAFKMAGSMAFKDAFLKSKPVLLEPIYEIEVKAPSDNAGDVMGDLSSKRGKIMGMDPQGKWQIIKAQVPLAELYKYSVTLRSLTQGRGIHTQDFSHYEEVPRDIAEKVIEEAKRQKEEVAA